MVSSRSPPVSLGLSPWGFDAWPSCRSVANAVPVRVVVSLSDAEDLGLLDFSVSVCWSPATFPLALARRVLCLAPCTSGPPSRVDTVLFRLPCSPASFVSSSNLVRDDEARGICYIRRALLFSRGRKL